MSLTDIGNIHIQCGWPSLRKKSNWLSIPFDKLSETSFTGISIILNWRDESKDLTRSNKRIVSKTISICKNDSYNTNKKIKHTFSEHLNMELDTSNQLQAEALVFFSTIQPYLIWGTLTGLLDTSNSKTQHKFHANFINYYRSGYG